jgi:hypothetical protein
MQPKRERETDAIVIGRQHEGVKAECIESLPEGVSELWIWYSLIELVASFRHCRTLVG